jgi:hypothetical protein
MVALDFNSPKYAFFVNGIAGMHYYACRKGLFLFCFTFRVLGITVWEDAECRSEDYKFGPELHPLEEALLACFIVAMDK